MALVTVCRVTATSIPIHSSFGFLIYGAFTGCRLDYQDAAVAMMVLLYSNSTDGLLALVRFSTTLLCKRRL